MPTRGQARGPVSSREFNQILAMGPTLPSKTVAQLAGEWAASGNAGRLVYCSNGAAGAPCLAYSNGTSWLRVLIGAAVAAV